MRGKRFCMMALLLALTSLYLAPLPVARAATITVNTTDDELNYDGDCSLREAILAANTDTAVDGCTAGSGADTITLPAGIYTLTIPGAGEENNVTGDLDITWHYLTINGDGRGNTIIQAGTNSTNGIDRVLDVHLHGTVEINDVGIIYGRTPENGGGIRNYGTLTLNNSVVMLNTADIGGGISNGGIAGTVTLNNSSVSLNTAEGVHGGGIDNREGSLTLDNCTIAHNDADDNGGGIAIDHGVVTLDSCTVSGNDAGGGGGGIYNFWGNLTLDNCTVSGNDADMDGGGIYHNYGVQTLNNSTVARNTADDDNDDLGDGGGVRVGYGTVSVMNTIVGDNQDRSGEAHDCSGYLTSQGYNLVEDTTGCTILGDTTSNITGSDPDLGPLAYNGGPTWTHALQTGSPAIEQIPNGTNGCQAGVSTDQRGYRRAGGAGYGGSLCDIGAYEYETAPPVVRFSSWLGIYVQDENGGTATITVTLNAASGNTVTVDYATSDSTATAGSDYTAVSGTLTFNPGVTSQTFTVPILDDALEEGNEIVVLTLSNPTNATIGDPNPGVLVIVDDESAPPVSPVYLPIILKNH
jgi:CSLREA domain-containing protein